MTDLPESKLTKRQVKKYTKTYLEDGDQYKITLNIRYDDKCGNGHNSFGMTADIYRKSKNSARWLEDSFGCQHEKIAKHFPKYAKFIKWHLTSSDGPMHYLANTLYLASDKDCHGKRKGEPWAWDKRFQFKVGKYLFPLAYTPKNKVFREFLNEYLEMVKLNNPRSSVFDFEVLEIQHDKEPETYGSKYTWGGFNVSRWRECPFDSERHALEVLACFREYEAIEQQIPTLWSEGKEPELENARSLAVWPDATLEQLQDKELLEDRLPRLMTEFKQAMEELEFIY